MSGQNWIQYPPSVLHFAAYYRPCRPRKPLDQSKGRTHKEGYAIGKGARDYAKTAGGSVNKQKTSKIYLMVLRRPGVLEGLPGKVVCSRLLARIDPVLFPMPYLTT